VSAPRVVAPPLPFAPGDVRLVPCLGWLAARWGGYLWRIYGDTPTLWEICHLGVEWETPTVARVEVCWWN
jgi:hypothetical protein